MVADVLHHHTAHNRIIQVDLRHMGRGQAALDLQNLRFYPVAVGAGLLTGGTNHRLRMLDNQGFFPILGCHPVDIIDVSVTDFLAGQRFRPEEIRQFLPDVFYGILRGHAEVMIELCHSGPP